MAQREEKGNEYGLVKIHKNVIAQIASIAAGEVEGVSRLSGNLFIKSLSALTKGKINKTPIKIELRENNEVSLSLSIVVNYGVNIPVIAVNVQENIKRAIETMTGLYPVSIHVKVKGVEVKK